MLTRSKSLTMGNPDDADDAKTATCITVTKQELDEAIQGALKVVTDLYERKLALMQRQLTLKERETKELKREVNHLEQYSRRSHLRIWGLEVGKGKNCKEVVASFLSKNLKKKDGTKINVSARDIDAAHTLPSRSPYVPPVSSVPTATSATSAAASSPPLRPPPPQIIVRFFARDIRDACMTSRRSLKGTKFSLQEDLTKQNVNYLKSLKACQDAESAWSWNGKLFAKVNGLIKKFDICDPLPL